MLHVPPVPGSAPAQTLRVGSSQMRRYWVARDIPRSSATWVAGSSASISRTALRICELVKVAPPTQIPASHPALSHRVRDAFACDLQFHLSQGSHHGEAHRGVGVRVPHPRFSTRNPAPLSCSASVEAGLFRAGRRCPLSNPISSWKSLRDSGFRPRMPGCGNPSRSPRRPGTPAR